MRLWISFLNQWSVAISKDLHFPKNYLGTQEISSLYSFLKAKFT